MGMLRCILLIMTVYMLTACDGNGKDLVLSLSHEELSLTVGEQAVLTVSNAKSVSATASSPVVSVLVDGRNILVKAVKAGEGSVRVTADGHRLTCRVIVADNEVPADPDQPADDYNFSSELLDASPRYVSDALTMRYDDCGVLFSVNDGKEISIYNLDNGDSVTLSFAGALAEGLLENARLEVNGEPIELTSAVVEQHTAAATWIHLRTTAGAHIPLVLPAM